MSWQTDEVRKVRVTFKNPKADRHQVITHEVKADQREKFSEMVIGFLTFAEEKKCQVKVDTVLDVETHLPAELQLEIKGQPELMIATFMQRAAVFLPGFQK